MRAEGKDRATGDVAGATREEKIGLLRSVPKKHPGCKERKRK
jgi:hypothetical protein